MALLSSLAWAAGAAGCLEPLPEPTACPPPARVAGGDCTAALADPPLGCFTQEQMECLTGPRSSCTCVSSECPAPAGACFPGEDCPPAVQGVAATARCPQLAPDQLGGGLPSLFACLCGCAGCAAVCDGSGPVMGVLTDAEHLPALIVEIGQSMPDSGALGIYLRLRGLANFTVVTAIGPVDDLAALTFVPPGYDVVTPLGTRFVEQVLFDDDFTGAQAYRWTRAEDKPTLIALVPLQFGGGAIALSEIDCIVPFVVPVR